MYQIKIEVPACQDHVKCYLTSKHKYRFYTYHSYSNYNYFYTPKEGESFQTICTYCNGWKDLGFEEIYGRKCIFSKKEALEIRRHLFDSYPSHMAKKLYKNYRRLLNKQLSIKANNHSCFYICLRRLFKKIFGK